MIETAPQISCLMCNPAFCKNENPLPSNINVVKVNCIGAIKRTMVLELFEKGSDAVLLAGCQLPDCHFVDVNLHAERNVKILRKLLVSMKVEPDRLGLVWYSPNHGSRFLAAVQEFSEKIGKLGPSLLKNAGAESMALVNMSAAKEAAEDFRLKVILGKEKELTERLNVYGEKLSSEEFDALINDIVEDEFIRHKIHILTKNKPLSVKNLAEATELKPAIVLKQIVNLRRKNMIALNNIEGATPFYKALEV